MTMNRSNDVEYIEIDGEEMEIDTDLVADILPKFDPDQFRESGFHKAKRPRPEWRPNWKPVSNMQRPAPGYVLDEPKKWSQTKKRIDNSLKKALGVTETNANPKGAKARQQREKAKRHRKHAPEAKGQRAKGGRR